MRSVRCCTVLPSTRVGLLILIGDAVYERDSETGEVFYDLDLGTVVDFYFDDNAGETRYKVRWDGNSLPDEFGYAEYQLKKVR